MQSSSQKTFTDRLFSAISVNDVKDVQDLLEKTDSHTIKESINGTNKEGDTPLMMACYHRNVKIVRALLEKGADVNIENELEKGTLIKDVGIKLEGKGKNIALSQAILNASEIVAAFTCSQEKGFFQRLSRRVTSLTKKKKKKDEGDVKEIVSLLMDYGANENDLHQVMDLAGKRGYKETADLLNNRIAVKKEMEFAFSYGFFKNYSTSDIPKDVVGIIGEYIVKPGNK